MAITDEDSARAWLETQSDQRIHIAFATRAALRATPKIIYERDDFLRYTALPVLRASLVSAVAANSPTSAIRDEILLAANSAESDVISCDGVARSAIKSAAFAADADTTFSGFSDADMASHDAIFSARFSSATVFSSNSSADLAARSVSSAVRSAASEPAIFLAFDWDAGCLSSTTQERSSTNSLFNRPLWQFDAPRDIPPGEPEGLASGYAKLTMFFDSDPAWGFWKRWLEGMRTGDPMDWTLQEQIALIGSTDEDRFSVWEGENAPQRIAGKIEFIEARYEAAKANKRLQAALAKATQSRFEVGGNFPPEPLEGVSTSVPSAIFKSLTEATATLSEELEKEAPDKEELEKSASSLRDALRKCRTYLAKTADNAAQKAVGTAAVSGSAELVSWISAKQSLIGTLLDALQRLLPLVS